MMVNIPRTVTIPRMVTIHRAVIIIYPGGSWFLNIHLKKNNYPLDVLPPYEDHQTWRVAINMPVTISRTGTMPRTVPINSMVTNHGTVTKSLSSLRSPSSGQSPFLQLHHPEKYKYIHAPPLWPLLYQLILWNVEASGWGFGLSTNFWKKFGQFLAVKEPK